MSRICALTAAEWLAARRGSLAPETKQPFLHAMPVMLCHERAHFCGVTPSNNQLAKTGLLDNTERDFVTNSEQNALSVGSGSAADKSAANAHSKGLPEVQRVSSAFRSFKAPCWCFARGV